MNQQLFDRKEQLQSIDAPWRPPSVRLTDQMDSALDV
jgi:hypothetical protein